MYEERIKSLDSPSFLKIRQIAINELSNYTKEERDALYDKLERGTALLDSHELLCQYLSSYGKMHKSKVDEALKHMPLQLFENKTIQIIDWGCGQGLATICFCDYIKENNISCDIKKAVLIEPATLTLGRAKLHVEQYMDSNRISTLSKYFNELNDSDIESTADVTLHFFSNILDVEAVDIRDLAQRISKVIEGEHYFVCIGPLNSNNRRIDSFYDWFNSPNLIWEDQHNKDYHNYTAKYKLFKIERFNNQPVLVPYNPAVQFHAAMVLDGVRNALQYKADKAAALLKHLSAFEITTPFDIGASIYEDVNPILAVLNNIIVRGLPTKASPFIERAFHSLGNKECPSHLGGIEFALSNVDKDECFLALHALDNRCQLNRESKGLGVLHLFQANRALNSITNRSEHNNLKLDFALEFPYSNPQEYKGIAIELKDTEHSYAGNRLTNNHLKQILSNCGWAHYIENGNNLNNNIYQHINTEYLRHVQEAYKKTYTKDWIKTLQLVLSPIAISRIEKTIIEAILTQRLDINLPEWNILVEERDVPCAVLAFSDLKNTFNNLCDLSEDYYLQFPHINLTIVSSEEFYDSPLHNTIDKDIRVTVVKSASETIKARVYDMIIDTAIMHRSELKNNEFSNYKCHNQCYFLIRSAHYIRSPRNIYTSDVINYKPLVTKDSQGLFHPIVEREQHLQYFLQLLFRKESFRPGQLPILSRALQNKSVIGLLPTGGGKSLTYQIAGMLQPGVTVIIDPLRSLMKDQYDGLLKTGIDSCTFINSTISAQEKEERAKKMEESQMQFVFMSPERLCIYSFREKLKNMHDLGVYFSYGVIDEVHCVSEWGHDFRFTYLHLGRNLYNYVLPKQTKNRKHLTLFGLTATASFDVMADVERELSGNGQFPLDSDCIVRDENTNRLELQYKIEKVHVEYKPDQYYDKNHNIDPDLPRAVNITDKWANYTSKQSFLRNYIDNIPEYLSELQTNQSLKCISDNFYARQNKEPQKSNSLPISMPQDFAAEKEEYEQAGIVFCPHKKGTGISVEENARSVSGLMKVGTFMGSSGESDKESEEIDRESFKNLELFRENKLPLMIATKAFGMGIDKPNVRFTININYSSSLESFVQEAGRAGRDRHIALAVILLSDYELVRISPKYNGGQFPLGIIKNRWFKRDDLSIILDRYNLYVPDEYIDSFTPDRDMVKLRCEVCNTRFAFGKCGESCDRCNKGPCRTMCSMYNQCQLRKVPREAKGFQYVEDLKEILNNNNLSISSKYFEYQNVDYETVMYFYNNNFKGSLIEKRTMYDLLSRSSTSLFSGNDAEYKQTYEVSDFLQELLNAEVGKELVAFISSREVISKANKDEREKADVAKAIYRMCCIGLIDDFTEDYSRNAYRVVAIRKADGQYYAELQKYLERYYSKAKAAEEIKKVPNYKGENEIHKCLGYLTEFIYDKIAVKRKRAIDDIRTFCMLGVQGEDWLKSNEELKDFIYYYFNSKYARRDFEYPDLPGDNQFSLTTETDNGKESDFQIVLKYMTVVDDIITSQDSSSQVDNIKHLQGAVRLIRRSLTDSNPTIDLLNVFCILFLGVADNDNILAELKESYINAYLSLSKENQNYTDLSNIINLFHQNLLSRKIDAKWVTLLEEWAMEAEIELQNTWINSFKQKYLN